MRKDAVQQERDRISGTIRRTNSVVNFTKTNEKSDDLKPSKNNINIDSPLKYSIFF